MSDTEAENPLLAAWTTPFEVPPFGRIVVAHFRPAFAAAIAEHQREIDAIARNPAVPSFDNTIAALERSGKTLSRVESLFSLLAGADAETIAP